MDDWNWASPVALARHAPIAEPVHGGRLAPAECFQPFGSRPFGLSYRQAVEKAGVEQDTVVDMGGFADREGRRVGAWRQHDGDHLEPVFSGEFEVTVVMRRTAEYGPRAILHQHEIRDVDGHM